MKTAIKFYVFSRLPRLLLGSAPIDAGGYRLLKRIKGHRRAVKVSRILKREVKWQNVQSQR